MVVETGRTQTQTTKDTHTDRQPNTHTQTDNQTHRQTDRQPVPASVLQKAECVGLVQVEVSGKFPQVRLVLPRLIHLQEEIYGILSVCI